MYTVWKEYPDMTELGATKCLRAMSGRFDLVVLVWRAVLPMEPAGFCRYLQVGRYSTYLNDVRSDKGWPGLHAQPA